MINFFNWLLRKFSIINCPKSNNDFLPPFMGRWKYLDKDKKSHDVIISKKELIIDNDLIASEIISNMANQLIFLDNFGFKIKFFIVTPTSLTLIDEADNQHYVLNK